MNGNQRWQLFFILPNLSLRAETPFASDYVCICSADDERMQSLTDSPGDRTGARMVTTFRTWFGTPYTPSCLLVRADAPAVYRNAEVLRAFRNLCAIPTTTHAAARFFDRAQWLPGYSDFFFFAAYMPGMSGRILTVDGMVLGTDHRVNAFAGQCAGQIAAPQHFTVLHDRGLFVRLLKAWKSYYVLHPRDFELLPLFRSLEVAFQAGRYPSDGLSSINDVGTRIGLWVSAFEVLFHPGHRGRVNKHLVQTELSRFTFYQPNLRRRSYSYNWNGKHRTNFAGMIYDDMYRARNDFMHGNPVRVQDLRLRRARRFPPLLDVAPILYNIGLRAYTKSMFALSRRQQVEDSVHGAMTLSRALTTIQRHNEE